MDRVGLTSKRIWVKLGLVGPQDKEFGSRWIVLVNLIWSQYNPYFTIKVPVLLCLIPVRMDKL